MPNWDEIFRARGWGRWPNTRFVEFAMRAYGAAEDRSQVRFIELGCGFGAQLRFLWAEGFYADGVDSSPTAINYCNVDLARDDLFGIAALGDVTKLAEPDGEFLYDCVLDVCCLQHLMPTQASRAIVTAKRWIKPGGFLWSFWAADGSDDPPSDTPKPLALRADAIAGLFGTDGLTTIGQEETLLSNVYRKHWIIQWQKPV